ncbi:hypothetical protein BpHYR1_017605 [Brachionus plicatilis]|uniref:Uncharacterized protein n=1 Tax=Brachionus plicatilis TaxID=10195 RepID=A0A3M7T9Q3_BRAPC|nr:hypothetical protein BpHYR1_017605 [Brachionus plicatilis]
MATATGPLVATAYLSACSFPLGSGKYLLILIISIIAAIGPSSVRIIGLFGNTILSNVFKGIVWPATIAAVVQVSPIVQRTVYQFLFRKTLKLIRLSTTPTAANAQHAPQFAWFLIAAEYLRQSTLAGSTILAFFISSKNSSTSD